MEFLDEEYEQIINIFQAESEEILSRLNQNLLELEKKPNNKDAILMLFRDAHSLKGASRLIGFNNVQTLAHKIEDILGLAKENKLQFNPKIVDVLYKTVDFLADLIQRSIAKRQEIYSEEISNQISALENIKDFVDFEDAKKRQLDFDSVLLAENISKINETLSNCLVHLMKMEIDREQNLMSPLLADCKVLFEIFEKIGHYEIKKTLDDIIFKLNFVNSASNGLTLGEIGEMQQRFDEIIQTLISVCEIFNLEIIDYYSAAFSKISDFAIPAQANAYIGDDLIDDSESHLSSGMIVQEDNDERPSLDKSLTVQPDLGFDEIKGVFYSLKDDYSKISTLRNLLQKFVRKSQNDVVTRILNLCLKIIDFACENEMLIEEEALLAIEQSIGFCEQILAGACDLSDVELITQRLSIVMQVLEINVQSIAETALINDRSVPAEAKNLAEISNALETSEIKTLRVDSSKLDVLVNQIGELMITKIKTKKHINELNKISSVLTDWQQNSLKVLNHLKYYDKKFLSQSEDSEHPIAFFVKQFLNLLSENNRQIGDSLSEITFLSRTMQEDTLKTGLIVDELEHMVKNIRVLPFATIFHVFGRMVRDIANEKGKKIELEILGSETSTDKKILEEIKSPLIHIIRNAIDHGIETPQDRISAGKSEIGKISLRAKTLDNRVIVEVEDDGRGINIEKIKTKAAQNGYLTQEEISAMTEEQLTNLIFTPGFSTGDEITNLSGRGIGLDVVQTKVAQLNGKIRVLSEINKGCCVQIELPTSMSTMKVFLVVSSGQTFAIPMNVINTVVWKKSEEIFSNDDARSIIFNEKSIPLFSLSEILKLESSSPNPIRETVLIIESDGKAVGICVDKLIGDQEILHKKLSAPLYRLKMVSGVTTLVSGEICLIINAQNILKTLGNSGPARFKSEFSTVPAQVAPRYKILLVDDSITTRTLEKNILSRENYDIQTATNPIDGLSLMKRTTFDLVITDVEMPEMDGFEFLQKIKSDEMYSEIPVVMVSSIGTLENKKRAKTMGAAAYIVKNEFSQDDFLKTVKDIFS